MLQRNKGTKHLATLMLKICQFLQKLREIDMVYGNLRPENILIKFDRFKSRIESIKLLDFGSTTDFESIHQMIMPARIDHIPPEILRQLNNINHFNSDSSKEIQSDEDLENSKEQVRAHQSYDVFSLGMLLLNVITGRPHQTQLRLMLHQKTVKLGSYADKPVLGTCHDIYNQDKVSELIASQEKLVQNLDNFILENDRYNLTRDVNLLQLLKRMLSTDCSQRPSIDEIVNNSFIRKWARK